VVVDLPFRSGCGRLIASADRHRTKGRWDITDGRFGRRLGRRDDLEAVLPRLESHTPDIYVMVRQRPAWSGNGTYFQVADVGGSRAQLLVDSGGLPATTTQLGDIVQLRDLAAPRTVPGRPSNVSRVG
jgi:hypothetical protein